MFDQFIFPNKVKVSRGSLIDLDTSDVLLYCRGNELRGREEKNVDHN